VTLRSLYEPFCKFFRHPPTERYDGVDLDWEPFGTPSGCERLLQSRIERRRRTDLFLHVLLLPAAVVATFTAVVLPGSFDQIQLMTTYSFLGGLSRLGDVV